MLTRNELKSSLHRLDGKGYKTYRSLRGLYDLERFQLKVDYVQGDPYARPSKLTIYYDHDYPASYYTHPSRRIALEDYLLRRFQRAIRKYAKGNRGSGKSGMIAVDPPGQEILERTAAHVSERTLELRLRMGLPAFGRRIAGIQAIAMLTEELPAIVEHAVTMDALLEDEPALERHLAVSEDADALRAQLAERDLIAFVADDAVLPRRSGVDPRPMIDAVPFRSPESLRVTFELPNRTVTGMGVPRGITLIVGGGYHGKSTLLNAIELGVYTHIPDDGREFVVADPDIMKIRAEDGRSIADVDISPFIADLPQGQSTSSFSTENASGSTSQAANIIEALEARASAVLIDEDTSATNFMIRDERMQRLVPKSHEPITPYIDKARQLFDDHGVSTLLVIGGSGAYFDIADHVICMIEYRPHDMTADAAAIAAEYEATRTVEGGAEFGSISHRMPVSASIDPYRRRKFKIKARDLDTIQFGNATIDIGAVEQLVSPSQTRAIGYALNYARQFMDDHTLAEVLDIVIERIEQRSLDVLSKFKESDLAQFRRQEFAAALNRLRPLQIRNHNPPR